MKFLIITLCNKYKILNGIAQHINDVSDDVHILLWQEHEQSEKEFNSHLGKFRIFHHTFIECLNLLGNI